MDTDFTGDTTLMKYYTELTSDLKQAYKSGKSYCFVGSHGVGKTFCCTGILRKALEAGYSGLYVTLTDVIHLLISNNENTAKIRHELLTIDFLVLDEFDPRHIATGSDKASDLYARVLEDIFRTRSQNLLPTLLCTNSLNAVDSFRDPLKKSIQSLFNYVTQITIIGNDMRKQKL